MKEKKIETEFRGQARTVEWSKRFVHVESFTIVDNIYIHLFLSCTKCLQSNLFLNWTRFCTPISVVIGTGFVHSDLRMENQSVARDGSFIPLTSESGFPRLFQLLRASPLACSVCWFTQLVCSACWLTQLTPICLLKTITCF